MAAGVSAANGPVPVAAKYTTPPNENTSLGGPVGWPWACSGDMNDGVPSTLPAEVEYGAVLRAGDAEVDHPRAVVGQQHIGRLEVAMHQASVVNGAQRLGQPGGQLQHGVCRQRSGLRHRLVQRRACDVGGGQPRRIIIGPRGDHRGRVRAVDRLRRGHLAPEPAEERRVAGQAGVDNLDRDRPATGG